MLSRLATPQATGTLPTSRTDEERPQPCSCEKGDRPLERGSTGNPSWDRGAGTPLSTAWNCRRNRGTAAAQKLRAKRPINEIAFSCVSHRAIKRTLSSFSVKPLQSLHPRYSLKIKLSTPYSWPIFIYCVLMLPPLGSE